jgi:hypothetical protein
VPPRTVNPRGRPAAAGGCPPPAGPPSAPRHHHEVEDRHIWPPLLARVTAAGDASGAATLAAMEAEHDLIDPLLAACAEGFGAMTRTRREFGLGDLGFTVPWAAPGLPPAEFGTAFAHGGAPVELVLVLRGRGFRRLRATAFRYLPGRPRPDRPGDTSEGPQPPSGLP